MNPARCTKDQVPELIKKVKKISQLTWCNGLLNETTRIAYHLVYLPALQYPLILLYMHRKLLDAIQANSARRFLTGMGYNANMPRAVVYAPKQLGAMGMSRLHTTQGVMNVTKCSNT